MGEGQRTESSLEEQLRRNSNSSTQQIAIFITFITLTNTLGWLGQKTHYIKNKIRKNGFFKKYIKLARVTCKYTLYILECIECNI